jgi:regulator of protease activity HflC (stomatin/prohibitin superfamily)
MFRYYKGDPSTYTICFKDGKVARHGAGINFWFSPLTTTISAIRITSQESHFVFSETTADFQEVAIQGALAYRLAQPLDIAARLDYTVDPFRKGYKSEDPGKVVQRVINVVQEHTRALVSRMALENVLTSVGGLARDVLGQVSAGLDLSSLGVVIEGLHFTSIKATPAMQKALEADFRESLSKRADQAIYDRRKAAVEEERKIRESEMNTEVELENRKKALVDTQARNELKLAEARAKAEQLKLAPYGELPPQALVGLALKEWAANSGSIGNLTITPDLLSKVVAYVTDQRAEA